jgi:multicomponent Na+:H+ antiporter subunit B
VSPDYIERSLAETDTPNVVTAVLADFRSHDTLGETLVIFTAALAVVLILSYRLEGEP